MDTDALRDRLEARREELEELLSAPHTIDVELDQSRVGRLSRMDTLQSEAMHRETQRRGARELRRIAQALDRLAKGDYGHCQACGQPIPPGRLEIDPAAALCVGCAAQREP